MTPLDLTWARFIPGDTLGKKIYNVLLAGAMAFLLLFALTGIISGKFWHWRANAANERADAAQAEAAVQKTNADNANGAAANATATRGAIDTAQVQVHVITDQAATRVESNEQSNVGPDGELDPGVMRELDAARSRARSAQDRLQRKGAR